MFLTQQIRQARGPRNSLDPWKPWHYLQEPEYSADGRIENVNTLFLTNRECPFTCLMCDLWKNTLQDMVPPGALPAQIDYALTRLPPARHIKLYNSGNFFDPQAVPSQDLPAIANRVSSYSTVIVENHPRLCGSECSSFQQLCGTQLEVALGLETADAKVLGTLNKQMTRDDFAQACERLLADNIRVRAFVLLKPPGVTEEQGIEQAIDSVLFAFRHGADCCVVIPTRAGNGILDQLMQQGHFQPPTLRSLEIVLDETVSWRRGRVFGDLWDIHQFSDCLHCADARTKRLRQINLTQQLPAPVACRCKA